MKKLLVLLSLVTLPLLSRAQGSGFGLGLMVGEPTGISWKYWIAGDRALDGGLAWGLSHGGYLHLHADYLFHKMDLIQVSEGKLPVYFGPGIRIRSWGDDGYWRNGKYYEDGNNRVDLGVRFPVGIAYLFDGAPVDVFLEVVPTLNLIPDTDVDLDAAIGARYWF